MFKKKITSAAILCALLSSSLTANAYKLPNDVSGTRFEEPIQILNALGIMNGDEKGLFRPEDNIVRSEAAKMAVHASGLEDAAMSSKGQTKFSDVGADHWASGYINTATAQGFIEGDGDGKFRPNDYITYAEAMTIMVRAIGYEQQAKSVGGYPTGYMNVGASKGLSQNVSAKTNEPISRGNVAYITENALEVEMMEKVSSGAGWSYQVTDKTLLKDYLDTDKKTGQITAAGSASLDGTQAPGKKRVTIGKEVYDSEYDLAYLLGYNVTYYINKDNEIILALPIKNKNSEAQISSEQFISASNSEIKFYADSSSSKTLTAKLNSKPSLIYNGKYEEFNPELIDLSSKSGDITLLDSDKDGSYDIIFADIYENMVVETVTSSGKIIDKYNQKPITLDDTVDYTIIKGMDEISLDSLKEFDVLSVYKSIDGKLINIAVSNNTVEGKISAVNEDGVYINGKLYKAAANLPQELTTGREGIFYLDVKGDIAASSTIAYASGGYGYLIRAYANEDTNENTFKLFTADGKEITARAADKIRLNGKSQKADLAIKEINAEDGSTERQLVKYTINDENLLTTLDTALDNSQSEAVNTEKFTLNMKLENTPYTASTSKIGRVKITDDTIVFHIPSNSRDYSIEDKSVFEDKEKYDVLVYDMEQDFTAKAVVLTNSADTVKYDSDIAVVQKISDTIDSDGESTHILHAVSGGKEIALHTEDDEILIKDGKLLEAGDIIQYKLNSDGKISSTRLMFDINSKDKEELTKYSEELSTVYGKITKVFSNSVNVSVNNGTSVNYAFDENVKIYKTDTNVSKNKVTLSSAKDLYVYDEDTQNRIFIRIYDDIVKEIVIVE